MWVLTDEALRRRIARGARAKMEREFDNRALVAGLEDIYDEVRADWRRRSTPG